MEQDTGARIGLLSPFGSARQETGLMALVASYLKTCGAEVSHVQCNGVFSLCDRDAESSWQRGLQSCLTCHRESRALSDWAGFSRLDLSTCLTPKLAEEARRSLQLVADKDLSTFEWHGFKLWNLVQGTWGLRYPNADLDLRNQHHVQFARRILLGAARMVAIAEALATTWQPQAMMVADVGDFISAVLIAVFQKLESPVVSFRWSLPDRAVLIQHPRGLAHYACPIVLNDIVGLRSDPGAWSPDLRRVMQEIVTFLDGPGENIPMAASS